METHGHLVRQIVPEGEVAGVPRPQRLLGRYRRPVDGRIEVADGVSDQPVRLAPRRASA